MNELIRIILKQANGDDLSQSEIEKIDNVSLETLEELYSYCSRTIENKKERARKLGGFNRENIGRWQTDNTFRARCAELSRIHELQTIVVLNYPKRLELSREVQELAILLRVMPEDKALEQEYLNKYKELLICTQNILDASIEIADARIKETDYITNRRTHISTVAEIKAEEVEFRKYINELIKTFERPILFYDIESYTKAIEVLKIRMQQQIRDRTYLATQKRTKRQPQNATSIAERKVNSMVQVTQLEHQSSAEVHETAQDATTASAEASREVEAQTEEVISEQIGVQTDRETIAISSIVPAVEEQAPMPMTTIGTANTADTREYDGVEQTHPHIRMENLSNIIIEKARILYPSPRNKMTTVDKTVKTIEAIETKQNELTENTKKYNSLSRRITKLQNKIISMSKAEFGTIWQRRRARKNEARNTAF